jgi:hypothetical protein
MYNYFHYLYGRYKKILRHQRLCKTCKVLDDEIYFFLQCQINNNLRNVLINNIKKYHANFDQLDFFSQLKIILIPDQEFLMLKYKIIKRNNVGHHQTNKQKAIVL